MDAKALGASVTRYNETARRREEAREERVETDTDSEADSKGERPASCDNEKRL